MPSSSWIARMASLSTSWCGEASNWANSGERCLAKAKVAKVAWAASWPWASFSKSSDRCVPTKPMTKPCRSHGIFRSAAASWRKAPMGAGVATKPTRPRPNRPKVMLACIRRRGLVEASCATIFCAMASLISVSSVRRVGGGKRPSDKTLSVCTRISSSASPRSCVAP